MNGAPAVPRHVVGVELQHGPGTRLSGGDDGPAVAPDATAFALWELCDGETAVQERAVAVCSLFAAGREAVERDIVHVLRRLVDARVLEWTAAFGRPPAIRS